jgi:uncharacterized membrane protein
MHAEQLPDDPQLNDDDVAQQRQQDAAELTRRMKAIQRKQLQDMLFYVNLASFCLLMIFVTYGCLAIMPVVPAVAVAFVASIVLSNVLKVLIKKCIHYF